MYVLVENKLAKELIPDFVPDFPDVPIQDRYTADFLARCVHMPDEAAVKEGWEYVSSTRSFQAPSRDSEATFQDVVNELLGYGGA